MYRLRLLLSLTLNLLHLSLNLKLLHLLLVLLFVRALLRQVVAAEGPQEGPRPP